MTPDDFGEWQSGQNTKVFVDEEDAVGREMKDLLVAEIVKQNKTGIENDARCQAWILDKSKGQQIYRPCKGKGGGRAYCPSHLGVGPWKPTVRQALVFMEEGKPGFDNDPRYVRKLAEESPLDYIAKGFCDDMVMKSRSDGTRLCISIEIDQHGCMCPSRTDFLEMVPKEVGIYLWIVYPPAKEIPDARRKAYAVYVGRADKGKNKNPAYQNNLRKRFHQYFVQGGDGKWHFGDKAMPEKHFPVVDALTRGFTIEIRFLLYDEPCDVEDCLCKVFDFALNDRKSGPVRPLASLNFDGRFLYEFPTLPNCENLRMEIPEAYDPTKKNKTLKRFQEYVRILRPAVDIFERCEDERLLERLVNILKMGPEKEDEHGATELKLHIITTAESGLNIPLQMSIFNPVEGSVGEVVETSFPHTVRKLTLEELTQSKASVKELAQSWASLLCHKVLNGDRVWQLLEP
eukprot:CAMPEP_0202376644 /NCGR_PEP_ID=MMETSP1127-20130417/7091_1 /ASSEMBLY_ACC=CAM_ASM_000462 /TAXON_ID=3047 /ORGANISM="Dunaliella tertiolecta, Strain CCMP1320" /LENGTH=458 /DNA_ID=CAMNT_0048974481 /DNA_START=224 /DNA_END=1600 /DNA_ORIENTATION=-